MAIVKVIAGQTGVIQGPPGTGKSQTIANLIASLVANGRRVLFVAEKRVALEVALRCLQECDLGHIVLDLHGVDVSRQRILSQVARALQLVSSIPPIEVGSIHEQFEERRARLNAHAVKLHMPCPPLTHKTSLPPPTNLDEVRERESNCLPMRLKYCDCTTLTFLPLIFPLSP